MALFIDSQIEHKNAFRARKNLFLSMNIDDTLFLTSSFALFSFDRIFLFLWSVAHRFGFCLARAEDSVESETR